MCVNWFVTYWAVVVRTILKVVAKFIKGQFTLVHDDDMIESSCVYLAGIEQSLDDGVFGLDGLFSGFDGPYVKGTEKGTGPGGKRIGPGGWEKVIY